MFSWEKKMNYEHMWALFEIDGQIGDLFLSSLTEVLSEEEIEYLSAPKKWKEDILTFKVASIIQKRKAIWMALGDANSMFSTTFPVLVGIQMWSRIS